MLMPLATGTCLGRAVSTLEARIQSQNDLNKMEKGLAIRRVQVHADKCDNDLWQCEIGTCCLARPFTDKDLEQSGSKSQFVMLL